MNMLINHFIIVSRAYSQHGLGRDMVPSFIFRTLSPICILVRSRALFASVVILDLCIVSFALDSVSRCCKYSFVGSIENHCNVLTVLPT